jgi:hypothetical protein
MPIPNILRYFPRRGSRWYYLHKKVLIKLTKKSYPLAKSLSPIKLDLLQTIDQYFKRISNGIYDQRTFKRIYNRSIGIKRRKSRRKIAAGDNL